MSKTPTVIPHTLLTAILFAASIIYAEPPETDEMSPFKDRRVPKLESILHPDRDPITGEKIYTLSPYIARPMIPEIERLIETMKSDPDRFRTGKGWRSVTRQEGSVSSVFSPRFLPALYSSKEEIAQMRARDRKIGNQLWLLDSMIEASDKKDEEYGKLLTQQRFEIMKMKRESIDLGFDDDW